MRIKDERLYQIYKPLRNHLRKVSIENALYVIWTYVNNFQFGNPFPRDIEVDQSVIRAINVPSRGVYEWELALLAREMIVNGETNQLSAEKN
ncbi:MAG: hypothetical protein WAW92_02130 [Minisyncoccia bacterium]